MSAEDGDAPEAAPEVGEFGQRLAVALREAVLHLRAKEVIEVRDEALDAAVAHCTEAGLEARSPKQVAKRVVRALLKSDHVDEVYGTDEELTDELRRFLGV